MWRRRRPDPEPTDPVAALDLQGVPRRLQVRVADAIEARGRWTTLVAGMADGPLRARLGDLGRRIDAGVIEMHATTVRVGEVERVLATLEPDEATQAFKAARRQAAAGHPPPEMEALETRFGSVQRLLNTVSDADEQLRVLEARLEAAVARGAELAVTADAATAEAVDADIQSVVDELGALHRALDTLG